jgi:hypothetical protein
MIALGVAGWSPAVMAEVKSAAVGGFVSTHVATMAASPDKIWAQLIKPERWWNKDHTYSGDAANLSLAAKAGGCFCETLAKRGSVEHARVVYLDPGKALRLSGALGPLQGEAVVGTLTVTIKPKDSDESVLAFDYVVGGAARFDMNEMAKLVDTVIGEQHRRLTTLVRSGKPD